MRLKENGIPDRLPLCWAGGFSMIEVLVSIVILMFGLLGFAGLYVKSLQAASEAYDRVQALLLAESMVNRISMNRQTAPCYALTGSRGEPYFGVADGGHAGAPVCSGYGDADSQARADADIAEWNAELQGSAERLATGNAGGALSARGCIFRDAASGVYTVAVTWQGMTDVAVPSNSCGANRYGSEGRRRVVWVTFKIATLL
jgi:type IV pilus assembly protein PilV